MPRSTRRIQTVWSQAPDLYSVLCGLSLFAACAAQIARAAFVISSSVICLCQSSYECYAFHSAALEHLTLAHHVALHLPCSFSRSARRSANVLPSMLLRRGHALSDDTRCVRPIGAACCGLIILKCPLRCKHYYHCCKPYYSQPELSFCHLDHFTPREVR
jgi:hypothetical protein